VTRHSWRAYYNADLPSAIMGRYLIVFSVLYFIIAIVIADHFKPDKYRSGWFYFLIAQVLPMGMVTFAYFTLIQGSIVPTDGDLLKSLGSVDAFFTEILGPLFFVLLFLIYGATNWLIYIQKKQLALAALAIGLVIYYLAGVPAYFRDLMSYQTYPYLAKQISTMLPPPDPKSGEVEQISVFLPAERSTKNGSEIYNTLRTHGFNETVVEGYSQDAVDQMSTRTGFIILQLPDVSAREDLPVYEINDTQFQIIPIER
jgi:hypothetical protein